MSNRVVAFFGLVSFLLLPISPGIACGPPITFQDGDTSSIQEGGVIKAVETAGGRVSQISAADKSREINFYLSSLPIKDQQLNGIKGIGNVIWVNLAGTEISNDGLKFLVGMPLVKLHLEKTKIGDAGLEHLKSFSNLEYLNLYGTQVTDAGMEHLAGLKNLKKLYVWKTGVTEAGMKKLNESLPDLEIVGEVKLETIVIEEPKVPKKESEKKLEPEKKKEDKQKSKK